MRRNLVFETLHLTPLHLPHWEILSKSEFKEVAVMKRDVDRVRKYGADGKDMEECNAESSAYECIWLYVEERRSSIKRRKSVGDRTQP